MIVMPGLCIKCGKLIVQGNAPGPQYEHVTLRIELDDGGVTDMDVAICHFCDLTESCWEEVIKAHNEYFAMGGSIRIKGKVKEQVRRRNRAELQIMRQGGKCLGCYKEIGENFINTNGLILHEGCNLPEPGPVKARSVAPDKVVLIQ